MTNPTPVLSKPVSPCCETEFDYVYGDKTKPMCSECGKRFIPPKEVSKPVRERKIFGMSKLTPKLETVDLELADVDDNILAEVAEDMARKEAEKKESNVLKFVDERGFKKLFFKRWLFIWCDMKGLNL